MNRIKSKSAEHLTEAISGLMYNWGGDAPPEAYWVLEDIVNFLNEEYDLVLKPVPESGDGPDGVIFDEIEAAVKKLGEG